MSETLQDLGERMIVASIVSKYATATGDDCASLRAPYPNVVVTTDPVPIPAAKVFGGDDDLYWLGWLLVTINASDVATAGARPLAFLAAIEAPASLERDTFERLLRGIKESCAAHGFPYVGGNLKEADRIHAVGIALGSVDGVPLRREGARPGDIVVSIGRGGRFWRDVLRLKAGYSIGPPRGSPIFAPVAQGRAMLAARPYLSSAIDNSDGLLPSLGQLASASAVSIVLDLEALSVESSPDGVDPARLWLGWGDWNVVATCRTDVLPDIRESVMKQGGDLTAIGAVRPGIGVTLKRGAAEAQAPRLESERFAKDSWFATGPDAYLAQLLSVPLP